MGKKSRNKGAGRRNTPLAKHRQQGKVLASPFGGLPNLRANPWLRDQFPDYLWVCWHLAGQVDRGRSTVVAAMNLVNEVLDQVMGNTAGERPVFDGSLTSWELLDPPARQPVLDALRDRGVYELVAPNEFAQVLGMYPSAPGSWLLAPWQTREGFRMDPAVAERALARVIIDGADGRGVVATQAKMLSFRGFLVARKIQFSLEIETVGLLKGWPDELNADERERVESFVRAAFGATSAMTVDEEGSGRLAWARRFWQSNWGIYPCRTTIEGEDDLDPAHIENAVAAFVERVNAQWDRFHTIASSVDPDLYDPDRYEVLTGLTARSLRIVSAAIQSPAQWTHEHSAASIRALVETLINITWLTAREESALYERFKEFGRGRLKLLKLHWEEYADSLDEVPATVQSHIEDLDRLVNQDVDEEFQNIDLGGTFAGIDARKMAHEVGLEREYRLGFAPSSSDAHGEWSHLERYALVRCLNPSHRWHRVPRESILPEVRPEVVTSMLEYVDRVIDRYVATIQPPKGPAEGASGIG